MAGVAESRIFSAASSKVIIGHSPADPEGRPFGMGGVIAYYS
jgi:hypothetical protein